MSCLSVTDKYIAIAKNLQIDLYDNVNHNIIDVSTPSKLQENDHLTDITISADSKYVAAITSISKQLVLYELPISKSPKLFSLPRSASKIRFTVDNCYILVADKSGDVLIYDLNKEDTGTKLLGHLSLLLDILQTNDGKFIITSDRDEKIKVSSYPNTYSIQTYCLGHKEFVNHIELLPHDNKLLISSSGDGTLKIWTYTDGKAYYTINTYINIEDDQLKNNFTKKMDDEGIEVDTLPIVHLAVTKLNEDTSLLAATVHTYNTILIYSLTNTDNKFSYKLETKLPLSSFPTAIQFNNSTLLIYNDSECNVNFYEYQLSNDSVSFQNTKTENVFENVTNDQSNGVENHFESMKLLYKRKFDNVQEYLERKKQRLEKNAIKNYE